MKRKLCKFYMVMRHGVLIFIGNQSKTQEFERVVCKMLLEICCWKHEIKMYEIRRLVLSAFIKKKHY